jgi:tRNA pseudouridine55 synthase
MLHGALVIDKPSGMTSHDVVATARRQLGTRRVGHAGTLDPMATGVLVVLVGEAVKLSASLTRDGKSYLARVAFGRATDSDDADGRVLEERALTPGWLAQQRLNDAVNAELTRTAQVPPSVSAIHVHGERAHRLSRKGRPPELEARPVRIETLRILAFDDAGVSLELSVSKGYYVRALARDLGVRLGVPAHLAELRRLRSGNFTLDDANPWPLPEVPRWLSLLETARRALPVLELTETGARRARLGQPLSSEHLTPELAPATAETYALQSPDGHLVALAHPTAEGGLRIARGFAAV